jgi:hypothetical protein
MKARLILEGWGEKLVEFNGGTGVRWNGLYLSDGTVVEFVFEPYTMRVGNTETMRADGPHHPAGQSIPMWLTDVKVTRPKGWVEK